MIRWLVGYIQSRRALLIFFAANAVLISMLWLLGGGDRALLGYALLLSAFALCIVCIWDIARVRAKQKRLSDILSSIATIEELPEREADGCVEELYADIARALLSRLRETKTQDARELSQSLDYYAMWVHQIKTPITALRVLSHGAEKRILIDGELIKIERYVDMALGYVRSRDLASDMRPQGCDALLCARACVKKYAPLFISKGLTADVSEGALPVTTDPKWLSFIIEQLISNAVKYTHTGGISIYTDEGALVVSDTGVGIRDEDLPRVFERGFTGYNGRVDMRASGLGLYLSRRVAQALGIGISLSSKYGHGTRVSLHFPKDVPQM